MIVTGALLVGISVSQHQHRDRALGLQAARKAEVDRAAVIEAQQFQAVARPLAHQADLSAKIDRDVTVEAPKPAKAGLLRTASLVAATEPARQQPSPSRPRPLGATHPGAVSEIRGAGATLVIPALGVHAPIVATGAINGSMTIPADIHTVGWYDGSDSTGGTTISGSTPWPGQSGVSLLAGHIDWAGEGPGALYYIGQLVVGDLIEVIGSNRETTYWRVSQPPITISKAALPADLFSNRGPPELALVTCGGPFDAATRHYLDNVIVWAALAR
jgi:Sortase domain